MSSLTGLEIALQIILQFTPVWIALAVTVAASIYFKDRLGLYGHLFDSRVGTIGLLLVLFSLV